MLRSFHLGSVFHIPLYIHPSFLLMPLVVAILNWSLGLQAVLFSQFVLLSVFGCVLLHELGHALMARWFGISTRDITLYPIGGIARLESTGNRPVEEICIALAGPAVNFVLVLLLSPLVALCALSGLAMNPDKALGQGALAIFASYLAVVWAANGVLMLFNLLPVFPMDGGRVLRAILSTGLGPMKATEIAAALAILLALGLSVLGVILGSISLILVPLFVIFAGQMELYQMRRRAAHRAALAVVEPLALNGFTGLVWNPERRVWVRWVNGRPAELW